MGPRAAGDPRLRRPHPARRLDPGRDDPHRRATPPTRSAPGSPATPRSAPPAPTPSSTATTGPSANSSPASGSPPSPSTDVRHRRATTAHTLALIRRPAPGRSADPTCLGEPHVPVNPHRVGDLADEGGLGQPHRHDRRVLRLLHLRHRRRAGLPQAVLPEHQPAHRRAAVLRHPRRGVPGPTRRRRRVRPLRRPRRPQEDARHLPGHHGCWPPRSWA